MPEAPRIKGLDTGNGAMRIAPQDEVAADGPRTDGLNALTLLLMQFLQRSGAAPAAPMPERTPPVMNAPAAEDPQVVMSTTVVKDTLPMVRLKNPAMQPYTIRQS